jgi:colanic acid/amylovoran biosynthesis protein
VIKVLVINPNNWYNKGDVSNRVGLIRALNKEFGNKAQITIESLTVKEDSRYFKRFGAGVVESIFCSKINKEYSYLSRLITTIKNIVFFLLCLFMYRVLKCRQPIHKSYHYLRSLFDSDIVISSPGGFLQDYNTLSSLLPNMFLLFSAKFLKKPVIIYAQSLGPFRDKMLRFFVRLLLNRVEIVTLREEISNYYLNNAQISNPNIFVTADATFSIEPPIYNRDSYRQKLLEFFEGSSGDVLIGITVLGVPYFLNRRKNTLLKKYVKSLATSIDLMITRVNANIIFIPQVYSQTEIAMMHLIRRLVKNKTRVVIIEEDLSPEGVMEIIGCMDLLIGTRMHSNIFALIMGVPVIAIAYEHKTHGIMRMLGLGDWVIDIENINEDMLVSKIEELYNSRFEIRKNILEAVRRARAKSLLNAKIVRSWYESVLKDQK